MGASAAGAHDDAAACEAGGEGDESAVLGDMGAVLGASKATALADSDAGVGTIVGSAVGSAVGGAVGAGAVGAGV